MLSWCWTSQQASEDKSEEFKTQSAVDTNELASCLTKNNVTMYWTTRCWHCNQQKDLFWKEFANVNFIDCDENRDACIAAGIEWYPTWKVGNTLIPWKQSLERLAELGWCS